VGLRYKIVEGFPAYRVGTDGSVWSKLRRGEGAKMVMGDTWKKLSEPKPGGKTRYRQVLMTSPTGERRMFTVHRLVLLTFRGPPPPEKHWAAHNNGNRLDNRLVNLRWASPKENSADMAKHGTLRNGPKATKTKLTEQQVRDIRRRVADGEKMLRLSKEYGVRFSSLWAVAKGKSWKHIK
jgi:hypothetical protein